MYERMCERMCGGILVKIRVSMGSIEEEIARSGKAIFLLHTMQEATDFWREPARSKLVAMLMPGCGWCHQFIPELIKLAPKVANSDLLIGAISREHLDKVTSFIPNLQVHGFPMSILVDSANRVREVLSGYRSIKDLVSTIEKSVSELTPLPSLAYLDQYRSRKGGDAIGLRSPAAQLPSIAAATTNNASNTALRQDNHARGSASNIGASNIGASSIPPGATAGSGTAGSYALPPHLRPPPQPLLPPAPAHPFVGQPFVPNVAPTHVTRPPPSLRPVVTPTPNASVNKLEPGAADGEKTKPTTERKPRRQKPNPTPPAQPTLPPKTAGTQQQQAQSWCTIL
jgi:hypothetical protein